jgi:hypothetical protein
MLAEIVFGVVAGVAEKPKVLKRGGNFPHILIYKDCVITITA